MAVTKAANLLGVKGDGLPEGFWYSLKSRLLGPPLVNEQLSEERLSIPLALGVLSPDGISSSAYGSEEILIELLRGGLGIAAFTLLLPLTGVVLFVLTLVVLSYREVVSVYIRTGGSYVVARENFGPKVAQIAAVALMIDYTVTVAVQTAGGAAAIVSAFPALTRIPGVPASTLLLIISVVAILIMCYGNLRGIREAGRAFALPTFLFSGSVILMILIGLAREAFGNLPVVDPARLSGSYYTPGHGASVIISFALVFTLLRAFANGGSSLTGIEAVSNAVSAFRPPEGVSARRVLVTQGVILAFLVGGISWLAHVSHATPFTSGTPTVISQEANLIFGGGAGRVMFYFVQAATALILFTGGNTSFNGFPFLASFVAEDAFLPRWLTKRGHRLVFSNGIIVLTVVALALIITVGANVNNLVPFYAIGVFTGFSMAGFGMARYHTRMKEPGWRRRRAINFSAGVLTALVVLIFAVTKFTEGAWLIVIIGPVGVFALIRLNREYAMESSVLETISGRQPPPLPHYGRRVILVFVDNFDLATLAALRYARSLRPTTMRAVHFVIDGARAEKLREDWSRADRGITLDFVDCPDRRLGRATAELVSAEVATPGTHVTVILPRRSYSPLLGRFLHDRTADKIARVVSRIPRSAATIIPYDVSSRLAVLQEREVTRPPGPASTGTPAGQAGDGAAAATPPAAATVTLPHLGAPATSNGPEPVGAAPVASSAAGGASGWRAALRNRGHGPAAPTRKSGTGNYERPVPPTSANPIGTLTKPGRATVEGRVRNVEIRPVRGSCVLAATIADSTGQLTALFYGREHIAGVEPGAKIRLTGAFGLRDGIPGMINPNYELLTLPS
ncbi:MAG TPA: amino acid permease [Streptosporangiaceae bacterium]